MTSKKIDWNYHALKKKISNLEKEFGKNFFGAAVLRIALEMYVSGEIEIDEWEKGNPIIKHAKN